MKIELVKTFRIIISGSFTAYTTWLVLGISMTLDGSRELLQTARSDHSPFNYFMGTLQVLVGALAMWSADKVLQVRSNSPNVFIRQITIVLLIALVGAPLFIFIISSLAVLFGRTEAIEICRQNIDRLATITIYYLLVSFFVNRRLKNRTAE